MEKKGVGENYLCLKTERSARLSVLDNIVPYKKADSSYYNQKHNRNDNQRIGMVAGQGGIKAGSAAHQVETCIAES